MKYSDIFKLLLLVGIVLLFLLAGFYLINRLNKDLILNNNSYIQTTKPLTINIPEEISQVSFNSQLPDTLLVYRTRDSIFITFKTPY